MPSSVWLDDWMTASRARWSSDKALSPTMRSIPRMPFMGVRISWLMVARNSLFA